MWLAHNHETVTRMFMSLADQGKEVVDAALEDAGLRAADVDFYASHQATSWFSTVTRDYIGMGDARTMSTYPFAGNLSACNVPFVLETARSEGLLRDDDVVATYSGGSGVTYSSLVMRWGR